MLLQRGLRLQRLVCGRRLFAVTRWYSQRTASAGLSAGGGVGSVAACRPPPLGCAAAAPALHPTGRRCCTAAAASSHAPDRGGAGDAPSAEIPAADEPFSFCVEHGQLGGKAKARLDAYLAAVLPDASRAKIAASVKAGRVSVNGAACAKPSAALRAGDRVGGSLLPPEPCTAEPESIPLAIVYEDDAVIVVNKAPGMVVHLSPGHARGTLVNALLAHCGLPSMSVPSGSARAGGGGLIGGGGEEGADDD
ncbi:pseudouridine synthase, partial [Raphidocelis subcapitata]